MEKCRNLNHSKMNVSVRNCSMCGEVVNKAYVKKRCSDHVHASRRKERNHYCVDCGLNLREVG